jgi:ABC-type antimicrobial peptide transport system permease subunit
MIWTKLIFGGFGRRGFEGLVACLVLALTTAVVASSLMVVEGARAALAQAERNDRPDVIQVKGRFNRAVFETPRSGHLPPATLPVYEPLIDPETLMVRAGAAVLARQSFLRNLVTGDSFLNVYVFGIDPDMERRVSRFSLVRGRFLRSDDGEVAVVDQASARALGVDVGGRFPVRKADGEDLSLTVVGILDGLELRNSPPRTVEAPALAPESNFVSSGVFVTLHTSQEIFARRTLTDALVVTRTPADTPSVVERLREAFRLDPAVFIVERYSQFRRKVRDFTLTLALLSAVGVATAILAGSFVANLLHDLYADRRRQYATLIALGFSPAQGAMPGLVFGLAMSLLGAMAGSLVAIFFCPTRFGMPSLMADLGAIAPRFDVLVAGVVAGVAVAAVALGMTATAWRLYRRPLAMTLSETGR